MTHDQPAGTGLGTRVKEKRNVPARQWQHRCGTKHSRLAIRSCRVLAT